MKKLLFVVALLSISSSLAWGQSKDAGSAAASDRGSDKLDLKNLEDKYWSAKDSDFTVVQNRTYTKANRFFTSLSYGVLVNDPYSTGRMTDIALGYYFSERWGLELSYEQGSLRDNHSTDYYKNYNGFAPDYNKFKNYTSVNLLFVPFYAKMSFMDKKILYFDIQFAAGIGQMNYQIQTTTGTNQYALVDNEQNKSAFGYNLDMTQQLFFSQHMALRLDVKNVWSNQKEMRYFPGNGNPDKGSSLHQDTTILLGLNIFY